MKGVFRGPEAEACTRRYCPDEVRSLLARTRPTQRPTPQAEPPTTRSVRSEHALPGTPMRRPFTPSEVPETPTPVQHALAGATRPTGAAARLASGAVAHRTGAMRKGAAPVVDTTPPEPPTRLGAPVARGAPRHRRRRAAPWGWLRAAPHLAVPCGAAVVALSLGGFVLASQGDGGGPTTVAAKPAPQEQPPQPQGSPATTTPASVARGSAETALHEADGVSPPGPAADDAPHAGDSAGIGASTANGDDAIAQGRLEAEASAALARGRWPQALSGYRRLAAEYPNRPVFALLVRLLERAESGRCTSDAEGSCR